MACESGNFTIAGLDRRPKCGRSGRGFEETRASKVFRGVASGDKTNRAQLRRLIDQLEAGDVVTAFPVNGFPLIVLSCFSVIKIQAKSSRQPKTLKTKLCKFIVRSRHATLGGISDLSGAYREYTF
jgi:hypothetical protein